jgi:hypothetical protein
MVGKRWMLLVVLLVITAGLVACGSDNASSGNREAEAARQGAQAIAEAFVRGDNLAPFVAQVQEGGGTDYFLTYLRDYLIEDFGELRSAVTSSPTPQRVGYEVTVTFQMERGSAPFYLWMKEEGGRWKLAGYRSDDARYLQVRVLE